MATWDATRNDWGSTQGHEEADFNRNGRLLEERSYDLNGLTQRTTRTYDDVGRLVEVGSWSTMGSRMWRYVYDAHGRPVRTIEIASDGTQREAETWGKDERGRRTKVQFSFGPIQPAGDDDVEHAGFSTSDGDAAASSTSIYDSENRVVEIRYHDASHMLLFTITLTRDEHGRIVLEEDQFSNGLGLSKEFDDKLARSSEEDRLNFQKLMDAVLDNGRFSTTSYERDTDGRLLASLKRIGTLDETRTTYAYGANGNVVETVDHSQSADLALDDSGRPVRNEAPATERRLRIDYIYDDRGNWIEKVSSVQEDPTAWSFIERRAFTYSAESSQPGKSGRAKLGPTTAGSALAELKLGPTTAGSVANPNRQSSSVAKG